MATIQTLGQGLIDPRHYGTSLYAPGQWLYREISVINAPFEAETIPTQALEVVDKVARLIFIILVPFALALAALGSFYNFAAHYINPLKPIPPTPEELNTQVRELQSECDKVFEQPGLPGLRGDRGANLLKRFVDLRDKVEPRKDEEHVCTVFSLLSGLQAQFVAAVKRRVELIQPPIRMLDNGRIPIPDRGNCFFEAVSHAYELFVPKNAPMEESAIHYRLDPAELRKMIINWEREHYPTDPILKGYIDSTIDIFVADKRKEIAEKEETIAFITELRTGDDTTLIRLEINRLTKEIAPYLVPESRFDHYFKKAAENGFWAGLAEFYAFAKIYDVKILVREETQKVEKPLEHCMRFNEAAPKSMTIWWIDGHHFEVRVESD